MRSLIALCLTFCPVIVADAAGVSKPYVVQGATSGVTLRSGPGEQYYGTHQLARGAQVEVYRRESTGWLAVRPPEDSFSWVASSDVRSTDDSSVVEVVGRRVVSWVGTNLSEEQDHKWQVQLEAGERLTLLGRESLRMIKGAPVEPFVKIAPPAGEFRWVHESQVRRSTEQASTDQASAVQLAEYRVENDSADQEQNRSGFVARNTKPGESRIALLDKSVPAPHHELLAADTGFDLQVRAIDIRLALEVAQPPLTWDLAPLRQEIGALTARADSTLSRARARRVQQKVEEFEALQRRYLGLEDNGAGSQSSDARDLSTTEPSGQALNPRFDGQGWLLPVHSERRASPPYALLDGKGKILQFVSPAPGLNLHRHLRRQVGIVGQRTTSLFLDKPHLTAHRVVNLARHGAAVGSEK